MTISSATRTILYTGGGTSFSVPFMFMENSHLKVTEFNETGVATLLVEGATYTVAGAGEESGGTVTASPAIDAAHTLRIDRVIPIEQLTDIKNLGAFYPEIHEAVFDLLTMLIAQETSGAFYTTVTRPTAAAALNGRNIIVKDSGAAAVRQVCLETAVAGVYGWKTYTLT